MTGKLALLYAAMVGTSAAAIAILSETIPNDFETYRFDEDKKLIPTDGSLPKLLFYYHKFSHNYRF